MRSYRAISVLVTGVALGSGLAHAEVRQATPAEVRGWQTKGTAVVLVDCRHPEAFVEKHLTDAINVPTWQMRTANLPRDTRLVRYCGGEGCGESVGAK